MDFFQSVIVSELPYWFFYLWIFTYFFTLLEVRYNRVLFNFNGIMTIVTVTSAFYQHINIRRAFYSNYLMNSRIQFKWENNTSTQHFHLLWTSQLFLVKFQQNSANIVGIHFPWYHFPMISIYLLDFSPCSSDTSLQLCENVIYKCKQWTLRDILYPKSW